MSKGTPDEVTAKFHRGLIVLDGLDILINNSGRM